MKRLLLLCGAAFASLVMNAQLLTWTPPFPKEADAAQNLEIIVDATKGNGGLLNYNPATDVYIHIGVITNFSTSFRDWKHVRNYGIPDAQVFNTLIPQLQATGTGTNKWKYTITGSLRSFFDITDASEHIQKIALLFRSGNGSKVQRNADLSDMFIPVYGNSLAVRIDAPPFQPTYTPVPEPQTWTTGTSFTVTANASENATLKLYHNSTTPFATATGSQTITGTTLITAGGNQQIIAEATNGTGTRFDTMNIFVSASPIAALPAGVRDGINYESGDTSVTLVLRAPGKNGAVVIGDFNNWAPTAASIMNKTPDGQFFWVRIHPLTPGTEYAYQYLVDQSIRIADPYAQKILDPGPPGSGHDLDIPATTYPGLKPYPAGQTGIVSVLQTAEPVYNWTSGNFTRPDKKGLVIYELLVRDFVGAHDWKTVTDSLNYLKNLGVNAIELLPLNEFEGNLSWGYNPDFYFAPDKYYGPKQSLKVFIDSCHRKGIAVIMDIALNHSFGQSPLVQLYWDGANNRPAANNPWFNPVAKHAYNVGFDMNHESTHTKYYVGRILEHWLQQYRVDGFRFDLSKGFTQKQTCDNDGKNCDEGAVFAYDSSRIAILKGYYDTVQLKSPGAYAIMEHFTANAEEKVLADYGMLLWANESFHYQEASMGYVDNSNFEAGIYSAPSRGWTNPHLVTYMESHDEERIVYKNIKYGASGSTHNIKDTAIALKRMELNAAFLFTIPGPKMIWQFGELGYDISRCYLSTNGEGGDCDKKTDPKPIRWNYFTEPRRRHVYDEYSSLIRLRFHSWYKNAFLSGTVTQNTAGGIKWIKVSSGDTSHLLVVGNFDTTARTATVTFPAAGTWYDYLGNTTFSATGSTQSFNMQPGEFHVYLNRNVNDLSPTPVSAVPLNEATLDATLYPNPAPSDFIVAVHLPQSDRVDISLYNPLGQFMGTLYTGFLARGAHQLPLKQKNIVSGSYYLKISTRSATKTLQVNFNQ